MREDSAFLRAQALRCRRLARSVATPDVAETLARMADEYESRAASLETERPPSEG